LRWNEEGNLLAVGTSTGEVVLYSVHASVSEPDKDDGPNFYNKMHKNRLTSATTTASAPSTGTGGIVGAASVTGATVPPTTPASLASALGGSAAASLLKT